MLATQAAVPSNHHWLDTSIMSARSAFPSPALIAQKYDRDRAVLRRMVAHRALYGQTGLRAARFSPALSACARSPGSTTKQSHFQAETVAEGTALDLVMEGLILEDLDEQLDVDSTPMSG